MQEPSVLECLNKYQSPCESIGVFYLIKYIGYKDNNY